MTYASSKELVWQAYGLLGKAGFSKSTMDKLYARLGLPEKDCDDTNRSFDWLCSLSTDKITGLIKDIKMRYGPLPPAETFRYWYRTDMDLPCTDGGGHDWGSAEIAIEYDSYSHNMEHSVHLCAKCGLRRLDLEIEENDNLWSYRRLREPKREAKA